MNISEGPYAINLPHYPVTQITNFHVYMGRH